MSRFTTVTLLTTAAVLAAAGLVPSADDGPNWVTNYAQAREAARAAGKPIFLVFRCER